MNAVLLRHLLGLQIRLDMVEHLRSHFCTLSREEQAVIIRRLVAGGKGEHAIAWGTGLSVELVRRILAEQVAEAARG